MKLLWKWLLRKARDPDELEYGPPWQSKSVLASGLAVGAGTLGAAGAYSPALTGVGGSYLGGFVIGWCFRRFVKAAAVSAGVALVAIRFIKSTGWIALDWASIESWLHQTSESLQLGAEGVKQVLMGYLPSAGAGSAGIFFGFRKM
jgi:uncharacterized membrane protein (Fun14 family)